MALCVHRSPSGPSDQLYNEASHNDTREQDAECILSQGPCGDVTDKKHSRNPIKTEAEAGRGREEAKARQTRSKHTHTHTFSV